MNLFGREWKEEGITDLGESVLQTVSNDQFGTVFVTSRAEHFAPKEEAVQILAALYDVTRKPGYVLIYHSSDDISSVGDSYQCFTVEELQERFPSTIQERLDCVLLALYSINSEIGGEIDARSIEPFMIYSRSDQEMFYLLDLLRKKEFLTFEASRMLNGTYSFHGPIVLSEAGWLEIEQGQKRNQSKTAFVAMWFDKKKDSAYQAIEAAVTSCGYNCLRISDKQHNNEISGEILYEIRKSKFLIADVTGQRHGVYFEAGYAMARSMPVIWCCHSDDLKNVHFDTRQYNHVVWNSEVELRELLVHRIKGSIE